MEDLLAEPDARAARLYPGGSGARQPVHTVYVPGDRYTPDLPARWGRQAQEALDAVGGIDVLLDAHGLVTDPGERALIAGLVLAKLEAEPIEDLRIDFEDGYPGRGDVEDGHVRAAARAVADAGTAGLLPPFVGIRFKCLEPATRARGLRTLALFVGELLASGGLPDGLVLTLPKVTTVAQVRAMVLACADLEARLGLATGRLRFEIQVETPQAILGDDGTALIAPMLHAGQGRVSGLHYGTYDYSASLGIAAADQSMEHPAADHAKAVMQLAAAGTGVHLSDGSTNVLPVGEPDGVSAAWALHGRLVTRSLHRGFYQGWDLHPAQLPSRFAATYAYFRASAPDAVTRLTDYLDAREGAVMDEPATAKALAGFVLRGLDCGALDTADLGGLERAGLDALARPARTTPEQP
nr:aldolase/citrate lyase family protein [Occultella gossypii]